MNPPLFAQLPDVLRSQTIILQRPRTSDSPEPCCRLSGRSLVTNDDSPPFVPPKFRNVTGAIEGTTTMTDPATEIDAFLATVPDEARAALDKLRDSIRAAAPDATERIGYGTPAFYYKGRPLVSVGAAKNHCSFYVQSPAVMEELQDELRGYETSKGTIRFPASKPLPTALVKKLVQARMKETDAPKPK